LCGKWEGEDLKDVFNIKKIEKKDNPFFFFFFFFFF